MKAMTIEPEKKSIQILMVWIGNGRCAHTYGNIHIYMDKKVIRIKSDGGKGVLNIPTRKGMKAMTIEPGEEQVFKY